MSSNDPKNLAKVFSIHSIYTQVAGLAALVSTNFLEVTKIRMISDIMNCSVPHYKEKTLYAIIKNKYQGMKNKNLSQKCVDCLPFRNSFFTFYHLIKNEGFVAAFFRGIDKTMASHLIRVGLFYPTFEIIRFNIRPMFSEPNQDVYSSTVASGIARSFVTLVSFPLEISKIMAQSGTHNFQRSKLLNMTRDMIKHKSNYSIIFWNFFQREMFFSLIFWYLFEKRRGYLKAKDVNHELSELQLKIQSAFFGGLFASILTFPYDIIQTNKIIHEKFKTTNSIKIMYYLKDNYGWSFLFNGLFVRMVKGCFTSGIFFTVYEFLKEITNHNEFNI